jgi:hypothetical protein
LPRYVFARGAHAAARAPWRGGRAIPIEQGRRVEREAGSTRNRFVAIPNAEHNDIEYVGTPAGRAIVEFLFPAGPAPS